MWHMILFSTSNQHIFNEKLSPIENLSILFTANKNGWLILADADVKFSQQELSWFFKITSNEADFYESLFLGVEFQGK